jgi:hypothetical protein
MTNLIYIVQYGVLADADTEFTFLYFVDLEDLEKAPDPESDDLHEEVQDLITSTEDTDGEIDWICISGPFENLALSTMRDSTAPSLGIAS